jgi:hypothetical protein
MLNKDLQFYTLDYSLILNLDGLGGVSGSLHPVTNVGAKKKEYPCKGCYRIPQTNVINLAFTIDWSRSSENEYDFTCFSGQIIDQKMLILDWVLINQKEENNYAVYGSTFLHAQSPMNNLDKTPESVKPYPINIELADSDFHE